MNKASLTLLALFSLLVMCQSVNWSDWVSDQSSNTSPFVGGSHETVNWPGISAPSGFVWAKADPYVDFTEVKNQYMWYHSGGILYCGPKSYLNANQTCTRNSDFWDTLGGSYDAICTPSDGSYTCSASNCCYQSGNGFFYDINAGVGSSEILF